MIRFEAVGALVAVAVAVDVGWSVRDAAGVGVATRVNSVGTVLGAWGVAGWLADGVGDALLITVAAASDVGVATDDGTPAGFSSSHPPNSNAATARWANRLSLMRDSCVVPGEAPA